MDMCLAARNSAREVEMDANLCYLDASPNEDLDQISLTGTYNTNEPHHIIPAGAETTTHTSDSTWTGPHTISAFQVDTPVGEANTPRNLGTL